MSLADIKEVNPLWFLSDKEIAGRGGLYPRVMEEVAEIKSHLSWLQTVLPAGWRAEYVYNFNRGQAELKFIGPNLTGS